MISSKTTEEKTKQSGINTLLQMEGKLQFVLQDVENMSLFLIGQRDIQQYLSNPNEDKNATATRILGFTTNLVSSKEYISNITIYPASSDPVLSTTTIYDSELEQHVNIHEVKRKMWTELYAIRNYAGDRKVITFVRPLRSTDNYQTLGWLAISLDEQVLSRYWSVPTLGYGEGQVALLNDQSVILSATDKSWLAKPLEALFPGEAAQLSGDPAVSGSVTYSLHGTKKTVLYVKEPTVGWTLISIIPFELYSAQSRYILQLAAIAVGLTVLMNAGLIIFLVQRVTNPLTVLTRLLTRIDPNEPLPVYLPEASDEIGRLAESYNLLGRQIETLKEQVILGETRKKEADLRALQAQINPHFLYNTLSSIHWIALMNDEARIADMVEGLSDFLRFSLNKGQDYCPVYQELAHIKNYTRVQSIRFPDKFDLECVVDPDLQEKFMLKLLLQPLVENAMIHGIQKKEGRGTITVYVERTGNRMGFHVLDDGVGMSEEKLKTLLSHLQQPQENELTTSTGSYGLRNVNERLQLHYGAESQLVIESRPNAGTRISFSIPILEASP
ncbi:cache domain-containing sensor histidine kinase [Paenibacillus cremeus]|nr:sensor histidine kinase [Paenibacillus cremeus]